MKQAVVDIDNSLLHPGRLSWFFWRIATLAQRLGRRRQRVDHALVQKLAEYDRVIILTSRDVRDQEFTLRQLSRAGIEPDRVIFCPRREVLTRWKIVQVESLAPNGPIDWFEDAFNGGPEPKLDVSRPVRLVRSRPSPSKSGSATEPEQL